MALWPVKDKTTNMLIVIEGLDGSGKSTQVKRLRKYLESVAGPLEYIHFPRYDAPVYGDLISRFLRGDFGENEMVHPQLVALLFAEDRHGAVPAMKKTLEEGGIILLDRYVYSNIAYLDVPIEFVESKLSGQRAGADRDYLEGARDIHEADITFQKRVREMYRKQCRADQKFIRIDCSDEYGMMLPPDQIFRKIQAVVDEALGKLHDNTTLA